ncbi:MAG: hypothetical protein QF561_07765, partial [Phycisphaerales bacterium]|nr:hypothetical protein [Phycisphaerales bacterium]
KEKHFVPLLLLVHESMIRRNGGSGPRLDSNPDPIGLQRRHHRKQRLRRHRRSYLIIEFWGRDIEGVDIEDDGTIGVLDRLIVLESWGPCV